MVDPQPTPCAWRGFEIALAPQPGEAPIETRTMDNRGEVQPAIVPPDGGGYDVAAIPGFRIRFA